MSDRGQFTFYASIYESIQLIRGKGAAAAKAAAYDAICEFALYGTDPDLEGMDSRAAIAFVSARPNLIASRRKSESGKKGGIANQEGSKQEANAKQTGSKRKANRKLEKTASEKESEKENEKENEKEYECTPPIIMSPSEGDSKQKSKRNSFCPPTVEQVRAYCISRGNSVDPQRFVDHYTANGWMVGKTKMKDWEASVRTWEKNQKSNSSEKSTTFMQMVQEGAFGE